MDEKPVVSALLITYNQSRFVGQALESILKQQTSFPIEVLVGDDCSTDETYDMIAPFVADPRVRMFKRTHNLGATRNLYDLQMHAEGRYIAYLEGDDYWKDPRKLQRQVEFMESHPAFIGCTHRCEIVDENGDLYGRQRLNWVCRKQVYTLGDFKGLMLPGHGNALIHRNIFRESRGRYEKIITLNPLVADRSLILLLASMGPIFRFSTCMGCYRIVRTGAGKNATALAYSENDSCVWDDYRYTKALEACAKEVLGVNGGFEFHKKDLFVSAVYRALRRSDEGNRRVVREIWSEGNQLSYLAYLPAGFFKKTLSKLLRRYA